MFTYEYATTASTMFCRDECKSLEEAISNAAAHVANREAWPLKILNDKKEVVYAAEQLREIIKQRFGVESRY